MGEVHSSLEEMLAAESEPTKEKKPVFLVYGRTGWIGGKLGKLLTERGITWMYGRARLEDRQAVIDDIVRSKCTHVLNAAGLTGRPNATGARITRRRRSALTSSVSLTCAMWRWKTTCT